MEMKTILESIDSEITRLQTARTILAGTDTVHRSTVVLPVRRGPGRPKGKVTPIRSSKKVRNISPEGRKRIAEAQKARWAASKKKSA